MGNIIGIINYHTNSALSRKNMLKNFVNEIMGSKKEVLLNLLDRSIGHHGYFSRLPS